MRNKEDRSGHFLHRKEGLTQGDPLAIITYIIGVLPIIRELRDADPRVTQPWYLDDAGGGGKFRHILEHFQDLQARGTPMSYFLGPTKSILVVAPWNMARVEELFRCMGMKIVTGSWHLGGIVGDRAVEDSWLTEKV